MSRRKNEREGQRLFIIFMMVQLHKKNKIKKKNKIIRWTGQYKKKWKYSKKIIEILFIFYDVSSTWDKRT